MIHRFGAFELDEERFTLRRGAETVEIEPRALELLIYLVRHPQRVVSKEELVREVWRGKFITDAAVTYAVGAARRALAQGRGGTETADAPGVKLATVHGRGYRLETTVERHESTPPAPVADALPPAPAPAVANPTAAPAPIASFAETAPRGEGRGRTTGAAARFAALAAFAAVVAFAAFVGSGLLRRAGDRRAPDASDARLAKSAHPRSALVLAQPEAPEGDVELHLLAVSLLDSLRARLDQVEGLTLLDAGAAGASSGVPRLLLALERDPGDDHAHLSAFIVDPRPGGNGEGSRRTPLERADLPLLGSTRDLERFNTLRERLAERLVAALLPAVELTPGRAGLTPRDPEAYRLYLLALDRSESLSCDNEAFVGLLRESVARDPQFAPAWEVLGWAEYGLVAYCAGESSHYADALAAAEHALDLAPSWAPAVLLQMSVLVETGHWVEAWRAVAAAAESGNDPATFAYARSFLLTYVGELPAARAELERSLAADPLFLSAMSWVPNALLYAGDVERYLALLPAPSSPFMRYFRGEALVRLGRGTEAAEVLRPAFGANPGDQAARLAEALLQLAEGNREAALTILRALDEQRRRLGTGDGETTFRIASLFARAGDAEAALDSLARAVEQGFLCAAGFEVEPGLAALAGDPRFAVAVARARARSRELLAAAGLAGGSAGGTYAPLSIR